MRSGGQGPLSGRDLERPRERSDRRGRIGADHGGRRPDPGGRTRRKGDLGGERKRAPWKGPFVSEGRAASDAAAGPSVLKSSPSLSALACNNLTPQFGEGFGSPGSYLRRDLCALCGFSTNRTKPSPGPMRIGQFERLLATGAANRTRLTKRQARV